MWTKHAINMQRSALTSRLEEPMEVLANSCARCWASLDALDKLLIHCLDSIPHCHLLYVADKHGKQLSANIKREQCIPQYRGQDLSQHSYAHLLYPKRHFTLSAAYLSQTSERPCITAIQPICNEQQHFLGFLIANLDLRDLPMIFPSAQVSENINMPKFEGLIQQTRESSLIEQSLDDMIEVLDSLMQHYGIFHCNLHFSSSQAMLWHYDDPYQYHLHGLDEVLDLGIISQYNATPYPERAEVKADKIRSVLERFQALRLANESVYLRAASLNIINGMVGLSFSYDGSCYVPITTFLDKEFASWFGKAIDLPADQADRMLEATYGTRFIS